MSICKNSKTGICTCAVICVVLLRVVIGWHYFYEGIHKFDPAADFSSKGFLGIAKGPTAELFYWMLPDINGTQRLIIDEVDVESKTIKDGKENIKTEKRKTFTVYEKAWDNYYQAFLKKHELDKVEAQKPDNKKTDETPNIAQIKANQKYEVDSIYKRYLDSLRTGAETQEKDVLAYYASFKRYKEKIKTTRNDTEYEKKRRWDEMMKYRAEAEKWTNTLDSLGNAMQSDLARAVEPQLAGEKGNIITKPEKVWIPNPIVASQMNALDLAVMIGLSAIGFCLIVGFCTRLAALGGIAFLVCVILTTWPVPGYYPPLPSAVGNFLFISKDGVELAGLLVLMIVGAGRWGGLDFYVWNCFGKKIIGKKFTGCCCKRTKETSCE
ncbi:MAG: DoxX family protein [Planctomycetaceae bacterium]|nr:DoxX family protein [Planctomycetaceae bacterium]